MELKQDLALAYSSRGYVYGELGNHEKGIVDCTRAIQLDPKNAAINTTSDDQGAYFWKGMLCAYFYRGRPQQAIEAIEKALESEMYPILLTPLYWLEKDVPEFFVQYAKPLLDKYEV